MAAERPIVASAIPSLASVIRDGETGLLVAPDDPRALVTALDRLHGDPDVGQAMAKRAREAAASLTWHGRAERVLETFAPTLLSSRRHRGAP
jgi:glycosyltransferase involved in cell wall biosynthesis